MVIMLDQIKIYLHLMDIKQKFLIITTYIKDVGRNMNIIKNSHRTTNIFIELKPPDKWAFKEVGYNV